MPTTESPASPAGIAGRAFPNWSAIHVDTPDVATIRARERELHTGLVAIAAHSPGIVASGGTVVFGQVSWSGNRARLDDQHATLEYVSPGWAVLFHHGNTDGKQVWHDTFPTRAEAVAEAEAGLLRGLCPACSSGNERERVTFGDEVAHRCVDCETSLP